LIVKTLDEIETTNKFVQAGLRAERQMAFYLKREFEDSDSVCVLNHLRLEQDGDSAQIDHLVIHKYGFIIIESKHIAGTVEINEFGEWSLLGSSKGIRSPIKQAERQASFLINYLSQYIPKLHRSQLENRLVDVAFEEVPVAVIVAISDTTNIKRCGSKAIDNICKAEAIVDKIKATINSFQNQDHFFDLKWKVLPLKFKKKTMDEIAGILLQGHRPFLYNLNMKSIQPEAYNRFQCRKCGSDNKKILYGQIEGKLGYHFKCVKCDGTMSIKEHCSKCGQLSKLRKAGLRFYIECKTCGTSKLFFTNTT
jgi:hypothetical protein